MHENSILDDRCFIYSTLYFKRYTKTLSQVASEYARICILIFIYLPDVGLFCKCCRMLLLWSEYAELNNLSEQQLKVFASHPSITKHWDCLKNDKLLAVSVVAHCCWDT